MNAKHLEAEPGENPIKNQAMLRVEQAMK